MIVYLYGAYRFTTLLQLMCTLSFVYRIENYTGLGKFN